MRILRRAWDITWNYRVLWLFGFLVALTTSRGGGGSGGGGGGSRSSGGSGGAFPPDFPNIPTPQITQEVINTLIAAAIGLMCFVLLLAVIFAIIRYVASTSLIRMVNEYETTGEKVSFRTGWRWGWSRHAFRLWLIDLLFGLGGLIVFLLALMIALAPLLLLLTRNETLSIIGGVSAAGLVVLVIFVLVIVSIVLRVLIEFFDRAVVIEDLGVFDAIRRGWNVARRRAVDVVIMALILFAIGLGVALLMIPVALALVVAGGLLGGLPGLIAGGITSLFAHGAAPIIVGVLVGLPILLLVIIVPMTFIEGLVQIFTSSTWTLTYREAVALQTVALQGGAPAPVTPVTQTPLPPAEPAEDEPTDTPLE